jgi:hypothetical protein
VTSNTLFEGVTGLGDLTAEAFVEVDAIVDASGNIIAKEVEVQRTVEASQGKAAFEGLVTERATRPSSTSSSAKSIRT